MTIAVFEKQAETEKLKILMMAGKMISEQKNDNDRLFLYFLETFYVAVKYDIRTDELVDMHAFSRIGRRERIEWKLFRLLPTLKQVMRGKPDGLI